MAEARAETMGEENQFVKCVAKWDTQQFSVIIVTTLATMALRSTIMVLLLNLIPVILVVPQLTSIHPRGLVVFLKTLVLVLAVLILIHLVRCLLPEIVLMTIIHNNMEATITSFNNINLISKSSLPTQLNSQTSRFPIHKCNPHKCKPQTKPSLLPTQLHLFQT